MTPLRDCACFIWQLLVFTVFFFFFANDKSIERQALAFFLSHLPPLYYEFLIQWFYICKTFLVPRKNLICLMSLPHMESIGRVELSRKNRLMCKASISYSGKWALLWSQAVSSCKMSIPNTVFYSTGTNIPNNEGKQFLLKDKYNKACVLRSTASKLIN